MSDGLARLWIQLTDSNALLLVPVPHNELGFGSTGDCDQVFLILGTEINRDVFASTVFTRDQNSTLLDWHIISRGRLLVPNDLHELLDVVHRADSLAGLLTDSKELLAW